MAMQTIIWRYFRLELPSDWEMLGFSKNFQSGRCTFADRYQHRLQFGWDMVPGPPDRDRMVSAFMTKLNSEEGQADALTPAQVGAWKGFAGRIAGQLTSQFSRYFPGEQCLVQMVFLWPDRRDRNLENGVLASVREVPVGADGLRRWRAFGMDMQVSRELALLATRVQCANVRLVFGPSDHWSSPEVEVRFERKGMVSEWLAMPIKDWLHHQVPGGIALHRASLQVIGDHAVETIAGDQQAKGVGRLLGRRAAFRASAWICPDNQRLYCLTVSGWPIGQETAVGGRMTCCEALAASMPPCD